MGVQGLLQELKSITKKIHLSELKGMTAGVDASCWLHRAACCCAREVVEGLPSPKGYVSYVMNMISLLRNNGLFVIMVFDGRTPLLKRETCRDRTLSREANKLIAARHYADGNLDLATKFYKQSIQITPEMVRTVLQELDGADIPYIMSPYESDAQLAWLYEHKVIDFVLSEDSDMLPYGIKNLVCKMDRSGNCFQILREDLAFNIGLSFLHWSDEQFRMFCCLSGCDYIKNLKNIGIKKAHSIVARGKTLSGVASILRSLFHDDVNDAYLHRLEQAMLMFSHQTVLNTFENYLQHLHTLPATASLYVLSGSSSRNIDVDFLGPWSLGSCDDATVCDDSDPNKILHQKEKQQQQLQPARSQSNDFLAYLSREPPMACVRDSIASAHAHAHSVSRSDHRRSCDSDEDATIWGFECVSPTAAATTNVTRSPIASVDTFLAHNKDNNNNNTSNNMGERGVMRQWRDSDCVGSVGTTISYLSPPSHLLHHPATTSTTWVSTAAHEQTSASQTSSRCHLASAPPPRRATREIILPLSHASRGNAAAADEDTAVMSGRWQCLHRRKRRRGESLLQKPLLLLPRRVPLQERKKKFFLDDEGDGRDFYASHLDTRQVPSFFERADSLDPFPFIYKDVICDGTSCYEAKTVNAASFESGSRISDNGPDESSAITRSMPNQPTNTNSRTSMYKEIDAFERSCARSIGSLPNSHKIEVNGNSVSAYPIPYHLERNIGPLPLSLAIETLYPYTFSSSCRHATSPSDAVSSSSVLRSFPCPRTPLPPFLSYSRRRDIVTSATAHSSATTVADRMNIYPHHDPSYQPLLSHMIRPSRLRHIPPGGQDLSMRAALILSSADVLPSSSLSCAQHNSNPSAEVTRRPHPKHNGDTAMTFSSWLIRPKFSLVQSSAS